MRSPCAIGLIVHHTTRTVFRKPAANSFHRTTGHQRSKSKGFMPLARAQHETHQVLLVCRSQMPFGAETSLAVAQQDLGFGPSGRTRGMRVHSSDRALGIALLLHRLKELLPDALPSIKVAGHDALWAITLWQITLERPVLRIHKMPLRKRR